MYYVLLLFISIIPAIVLLWFFERQDKGRKEPRKLKWRIFAWGILATFFAIIIELNIDMFTANIPNKLLYILITSFITAGLVEEAIKLWVVKTHAYNSSHFNEVMDGITYTIIASIGFAVLENILYVMQGGIAVGVIRAIFSVPAHALFSGVMGYYLGKAKTVAGTKMERNLIWKGLGFGVLYHGFFDFFLFTETILALLIIPLLVIMALHLKSKIKEAHYLDKINTNLPEKITVKIFFKVLTGTIFILIGLLGVVGLIMVLTEPENEYQTWELIPSGWIMVAFLYGGYKLVASTGKPPKK